MSRFARRILGVPLVAKLIGANVIIVASAFALQAAAISRFTRLELIIAAAALASASLVNFLLVRLALKPIDDLETLADRVTEGEFDARIDPSPYADKGLERLTQTVNGLLDSLALDARLVVVERNREILRDRDSFSGVELARGDTIEIVHFVGGG